MDKCRLDERYNKCKHLGSDQDCLSSGDCSMKIDQSGQTASPGYIRQERWYEKYYKKKTDHNYDQFL